MSTNYTLSACNEVLEKVRGDLKKYTASFESLKGTSRTALQYLNNLSSEKLELLTQNMQEYYLLWKRTSLDQNTRDLHLINKFFKCITYLKQYEYTIQGIESLAPLLEIVGEFNNKLVLDASLREQKIMSIDVLSSLITHKDLIFTFMKHSKRSILDTSMVSLPTELKKFHNGTKSWQNIETNLYTIKAQQPSLTSIIDKINTITQQHVSSITQKILHNSIPMSMLYIDFNPKYYTVTSLEDTSNHIESLAQYKLMLQLFNLEFNPTVLETKQFSKNLFYAFQSQSVQNLDTKKYDQEYLESIKDLPRIARIYYGYNTVKK